MTQILIIVCSVAVNFILYYVFGSLVLFRRGSLAPPSLRVVVGFFSYYAVFFFFCVPVMKYYRPLSVLTKIWSAVVVIAVVIVCITDHGNWKRMFSSACERIGKHPRYVAGLCILITVQIILVACTYHFTLDAAYYVAGVATNVDTNMINVYDPFTGAWQDHFEMRYFFATYSVQDAVVCQLTGIAPLIWTKSVMATVIILLTNLVYVMTARELFALTDRPESGQAESPAEPKILAMTAVILFVNLTFHTIYTASQFLMTRTYEGKAIVGNLAILSVFYLFLLMNDEKKRELLIRPWFCVFLICFGASTISSTANMLMPVELTVLFLPLIFRIRRYRWLLPYAACAVPGMIFTLSYVLYVKGYFVFYTYPR